MREMKDSGIEWIGKIPKEWEIHPLYYYFNERKNRNFDLRERNLLSLSYGNIIRKDINTAGGLLPASFNTYNIVNNLDIIIRPTDLQNDKRSLRTGLVKDETGIITSAYIALKPRDGIFSNYFHYLLLSYDVMKVFYNMGNGVRQGLNYSEFSKLMMIAPSLDEQRQIADFLDQKCSEIEALTKDIQTQIEILEEYKKSVITEAVTKGLDPNVEMKDSGIQWVDKIPANWKVNKIKYISNSIFKGQGIKKENVDINGDIQCVRYGEIYSKYSNSFNQCFSFVNSNNLSRKQPFIKNGDIIFAITGELIEEIGKNVLYTGELDCAVGGDIVVVRIDEDRRFVNYALNSSYCQNQKSCNKFKLKVVHISAFEIGNILVLIPPLNIQKAISDFLDLKCAEIDTTISEKRQQLETLAEYKKSLIYEYVTGKKEIA
ncbi:MAG: restriction endonuclease subunit S [Succinivibrionaceae bacterium]|nr:restriction endonuclease subunit S [Succinivibrionaceae bacterium]